MKILITGAAGRIGRAVRQALGSDHPLIGVDLLVSPGSDLPLDLADPAHEPALRHALQGVGAVVHAAALHAAHVGQHPDAAFQRVNVEATARLALLAREAGAARFVFLSTTALYGDAATPFGRAGWVDEQLPPQPRSVYHRSKLQAEAWLRQDAARGGLAVTMMRLSRCFAEAAPVMAAYRLHRGIDARDVAAAVALCLHRPAASLPPWQLLLLSATTPFEPADATALWHDAPAVLAQRAPALLRAFERRRWPLPQRIDRVYDAALARQRLGWQPRHGFDEVLRQLDEGAAEVLPFATG